MRVLVDDEQHLPWPLLVYALVAVVGFLLAILLTGHHRVVYFGFGLLCGVIALHLGDSLFERLRKGFTGISGEGER